MTSQEIIDFIRALYRVPQGTIPLHAPVFSGKEKEYLLECIDSTYVSSVGPFVDRVEHFIAEYVGSKFAVVTSNGTAGLHLALVAAGVGKGDEVITQPLSFIATANAISYCGAYPTFVDVDEDTLGLSPSKLQHFLKTTTNYRGGQLINRKTGRVIKACVPMHTFGHPCRVDEIVTICHKFGLTVIEDAAESIGSSFRKKHTGTFGKMGVFSFNGNKTITAGGGGAVVTDEKDLAVLLKHLSYNCQSSS